MNKGASLPIGPRRPWLAPLAGHSDAAFRVLCRENGAAVACTEMISAKGLVYGEGGHGNSASRELLRAALPPEAASAEDSPLVVQLFGDDPAFLGEAVSLLRGWGYAWFDLNLGCSVPKVLKGGAGAALAREQGRALKAAGAMAAAAPGSVGFKLRLGWRRGEENYLELGAALEEAGAAWLTLHPRYAAQRFSGRADWEALAALKRRVSIPVIASGDLYTAEDAALCLKRSGADGVMFARGALRDPAVFNELKCLLHTDELGEAYPGGCSERAAALKRLVLRHIELAGAMPARGREGAPGGAGLGKMRGAILRYITELPGSRACRRALGACATWEDLRRLLEAYFAALGV